MKADEAVPALQYVCASMDFDLPTLLTP